jgi:hypothetical protein
MKKMIETLEMQIAAPDPGYGVALENMLSEWGDIPYSQLSIILVHLRYLASVHQTHHWTCKGDTFYGDHLLFERLYNTIPSEIDSVAEKAIGLGSIDNVELQLQLAQVEKLSKKYGMASTMPQPNELSRRSLVAEIGFLRCVAHCVKSLQQQGLLTRGLDNLLAGIEDVHEGKVYLLRQVMR